MMTYPSLDDMTSRWCMEQLSIWQGRRISYRATLKRFNHHNNNCWTLVLFLFENKTVTVLDKPNLPNDGSEQAQLFEWRVELYRLFFQHILWEKCPSGEGVLAMDMNDIPLEDDSTPIFGFQKQIGSSNILINDIDFLGTNFYASNDFADPLSYDQKEDSAVFVGSTTGCYNTVHSIENGLSERVRAGLFFRESALVDFRLPILAHCDPDGELMLRNLGFGVGHATWRDQFNHKFMLSMDGNGATCSRVAVALSSNGVLMKYRSNNILHYFTSMVPWQHYIPIYSNMDVLNLVQLEQNKPGAFSSIASASQKFFNKYLTRDANMAYVGRLLEKYFNLFEHSDYVCGWSNADFSAMPSSIYGLGHIQNEGDVQFQPGGGIGHEGSGKAVEGFWIAPNGGVDNDDIEYQAISSSGEQDWMKGGEFAGFRGVAHRITGLRIRLCGKAAHAFYCKLAVAFVNGDIVIDQNQSDTSEVLGTAAIESIKIDLIKREDNAQTT